MAAWDCSFPKMPLVWLCWCLIHGPPFLILFKKKKKILQTCFAVGFCIHDDSLVTHNCGAESLLAIGNFSSFRKEYLWMASISTVQNTKKRSLALSRKDNQYFASLYLFRHTSGLINLRLACLDRVKKDLKNYKIKRKLLCLTLAYMLKNKDTSRVSIDNICP